MTKKFNITCVGTYSYTLTVEADSKEEAEDLAQTPNLCFGCATDCGEGELHIDDPYEVSHVEELEDVDY